MFPSTFYLEVRYRVLMVLTFLRPSGARSAGNAVRVVDEDLSSARSSLICVARLIVCPQFFTRHIHGLRAADKAAVGLRYRLALRPNEIGFAVGCLSVFIWGRKSGLASYCQGF